MLSAAAAAAMVLSVGAQAAVKDGTFEGTGAGRGGPVTVAVTEFPAGSPGLEPREECGLSKFFNLGPNAAKPYT